MGGSVCPEPPNAGRLGSAAGLHNRASSTRIGKHRDGGLATCAVASSGVAEAQFDPRGRARRPPRFRRSSCPPHRGAGPAARPEDTRLFEHRPCRRDPLARGVERQLGRVDSSGSGNQVRTVPSAATATALGRRRRSRPRRGSRPDAAATRSSAEAGAGRRRRRRSPRGPGRPPVQPPHSSHPSGQPTSPSTCTSGSSSTPKRSCTRRRPSAISSSTSAVVAVAGVLDEVGVLLGEAGAALAQAPAAGRLEQLTGAAPLGALVFGVLEGRAEGLDPRGLRLAALAAHLVHRALDLRRVVRAAAGSDARDDHLAGAEVGAAVGEAELLGHAALAPARRCRPRPTRAPRRAGRRRRWRSSSPRRRRCRGC